MLEEPVTRDERLSRDLKEAADQLMEIVDRLDVYSAPANGQVAKLRAMIYVVQVRTAEVAAAVADRVRRVAQ